MANTEVGSAYVSIYADISKQFGRSINGAVKSAGNAISGLAKTAGAVTAVVGGAAATGIAAIGKMALDSYAQYEQLSGGVDKLYGDAADKLRGYAQQAYATAGMSANQYMEQATSFSAALISSLGGDQQKAADMTDIAMRAMADNVNVFGSNMEDVQNAFQGFAKSNFTMLDNLKLGFAGTKEGAEQLVAAAAGMTEEQEKLGVTVDANSLSFDNLVAAIAVVQENMGIAGATANEAMGTIEGSINMTKAAWSNLLTELGKDDGDVTTRVQELMESVTAVMSNVTPVVQRIGEGLAAAMPELIPAAMALGGQIVTTIGQTIIDSAPTIAASLGQALQEAWLSIPMPEGVREQFDGIFQTIASVAASVGPALASVGSAFAPILDSLQRMGEELLPLVQPIIEHLAQTAGEHLLPALEYLGNALSYLFEQAEPWMPHLANVATIIGDVLIVALAAFIDAIGIVANILGTVLEAGMAFSDFIEGLPEGIGTAAENIGGFFEGLDEDACSALESAGSTIDGWASDVKTWFGNAADDVDSATEDMCKSLGDWADQVGKDARQAGEDFYSNVTSKFEEAKEAIEGIPDQIVGFFSGLGDRITGAIGSIHFPQPNVWFEHVGIGDLSIPIPHVDWYAQGAWFRPNKPAIFAGFGDNRRYDEVALPLSPSNLAAIGAGIARASDFGGGGETFNITVYANGDGDSIARRIRDELHAYNIVHGR